MKTNLKDFPIKEIRKISYDIDPIFINRWSPRAFSGDAIDNEEVRAVVEAGRLAPSAANYQEWYVIYAHRDTEEWNDLFSLLVPENQEWAKNAAVLFLFVSDTLSAKGRPIGTNSFDTGALWMSMALEAFRRGFPLHGMGGFDYEGARTLLELDERYKVEAMAAMGVPGNISCLSEEKALREQPSPRKSIDEVLLTKKRASEILARS